MGQAKISQQHHHDVWIRLQYTDATVTSACQKHLQGLNMTLCIHLNVNLDISPL